MIARYQKELLCAALLVLMGVNLLAVIRRKSLTNDEYYHIPAGYLHLTQSNFKLNEEHPPLIKMWSALPLLLIRPATPQALEPETENPISRGHGTFAQFWVVNSSKAEAIAFWARLPIILITLMLGLLIFVFGRQLFGGRAALFAVLLFCLEPTVLAHGRVVQTDLPAALSYLLFFFALRSFTNNPDVRRSLILGGALGLALVTKFSLLILVPVFMTAVVMIWWMRKKHKPAPIAIRIGTAILAALLIVNIAYFFNRQPLSSSDNSWIADNSPDRAATIKRVVQAGSVLAPTSFLFGAYIVRTHDRMGHPASLLGAYRSNGWWYYFPIAFSLKTSLPFLLLTIAALTWAIWMAWRRRPGAYLWLLLPIVIYLLPAMGSRINIGVRHLLPIFPFLFLVGGAFLDWILRIRSRKVGIAIVVLLIAGMTFTTVRAYPNYMSYMNELAARQPHWYYLSDSNIEWGEDTGALAAYLCAHGENKVRAAVLGGWTSRGPCGVQYVDAFAPGDASSQTRYVAIGASFLNGSTVPEELRPRDGTMLSEEQRHNFFAAYRQRTPETIFGNSIYLYRESE